MPETPERGRPCISTREFAGGRVTVIDAGTIAWRPEMNVDRDVWAPSTPGVDASGWLLLHTNGLHIETDRASIVVDPCALDPAQDSATIRTAAANAPLERSLEAIGVDPAGVTHVIVTHMHLDHCSGAVVPSQGETELRFPNAMHLVSRHDYPSAASPAPRSPGQRILELIGATGRLSLVDGRTPVADGVTLVPAPGETAGHMVVDVDLGSGRVVYAGDLFHFACEFEHVDWMPAGRDAAAMIASREAVIDLATATGASIVFTHAAFPAWGTCRWEQRPRARWTADAGA